MKSADLRAAHELLADWTVAHVARFPSLNVGAELTSRGGDQDRGYGFNCQLHMSFGGEGAFRVSASAYDDNVRTAVELAIAEAKSKIDSGAAEQPATVFAKESA